MKRISLIPEPTENPFKFQIVNSSVDIRLGYPIMDIKIDEIFKSELKFDYKIILQNWLELDQDNINNKIIGFSMVNVPISYETNLPLSQSTRWEGDLFFEKFDIDKIEKAGESFYKLFSQLINQSIFERDIEKFKKYSNFAGELVNCIAIKDSWSIRLLAAAINNGVDFFKLDSPRLLLRNENGETIDIKTKEPISELYKSKMP